MDTATMCQHCVPIHPALAQEATESARAYIQDVIRRADDLLRMCNQLEDRYRDAGITFHKTERAARISWEQDTGQWGDCYTHLEKAFLIDSYEDIFDPLMDIVKRLTELRTKAQHVPSAAKPEQLMCTVGHELFPAMDALIADHQTFAAYISKLEVDADMLSAFNRRVYQVDGMGQCCAWYDPVVDLVNNKRTVRSRFGEYTVFADWVHSLPEAQRALEIQAGHDGFNPSGFLFEDRLFVYAMDLIWRANDGFIADDGS